MTITITSTTSIAELRIDGADVPARLWEGRTDSGIPVHCWQQMPAVERRERLKATRAELQKHPTWGGAKWKLLTEQQQEQMVERFAKRRLRDELRTPEVAKGASDA